MTTTENELERRRASIKTLLRKFLEKAVAGELESICVVAFDKDNVHSEVKVELNDVYGMIGGLERLKYELLEEVRAASVQEEAEE